MQPSTQASSRVCITGREEGCVSSQLSYRSVFMSYRTDRVEIVNTLQYNDSANDYFEREPASLLAKNVQEPHLGNCH